MKQDYIAPSTMQLAQRNHTVEEINLTNVVHNYRVFRAMLGEHTKTLALVKADGYGTGSREVTGALAAAGVDYFAVATVDEGLQILPYRVGKPVIVLNPNTFDHEAMIVHCLEPEIYSLEQAAHFMRDVQRISGHDASYPIHVKIDSGMHRLGFTLEQLPALIELLTTGGCLHVKSIFTHLAVADEPSQDEYTAAQLDYFGRCADTLTAALGYTPMRHALNTSGTARHIGHQMDMVRIGVGLYGIKTVHDGSEDDLRPVASLYSVIISVKQWQAGTTIGYGRRGVLTRDSRIATVTIGYADGYDRHYGNGNALMWVGGTLCPTVGNVCMDAVMIDITDAPADVDAGSIVEVFGAHVPIEQLAAARHTIPYEVLTGISPRVKRVYVN